MQNNNFIGKVLIKADGDKEEHPFNIPIIRNTEEIDFKSKVTYFVGENGTGKSTLMEGIAVAYGLNPEGGSKNFQFSTSNTHSSLYESIRLVKGIRLPKTSYFLRSESFYNVASNIEELDENTGLMFDAYGGKSLHAQSHGESFMALFENRFYNNGLYLLDEPEAALSPMRQLSLLKLIYDLSQNGSQFIISTHSPILMACPESVIYNFDSEEQCLKEVEYEETEHYQIYKYFFSNRERLLDELFR